MKLSNAQRKILEALAANPNEALQFEWTKQTSHYRFIKLIGHVSEVTVRSLVRQGLAKEVTNANMTPHQVRITQKGREAISR